MFIIRPEQKEDILEISEVNNLAFKGEEEAKLVEAIRVSEFLFRSCRWLPFQTK